MNDKELFFEQIRSGGCLSYSLGCKKEKVCVVIDPEVDKTDEYLGMAEDLSSRPPLSRKFHSAIEWDRSPIQRTQRGFGEGI